MKMSDRPTPRTDSRKAHRNASGYNIHPSDLEFMRLLERELDEALYIVQRLRQDLVEPPADVQELVLDKLDLRSVITERNFYREALSNAIAISLNLNNAFSALIKSMEVAQKIETEKH